MYVCVCKGITEADIKNQVLNGATDIRAIVKNLGLASQCAKCVKQAQAVIQESRQQANNLTTMANTSSHHLQTINISPLTNLSKSA